MARFWGVYEWIWFGINVRVHFIPVNTHPKQWAFGRQVKSKISTSAGKYKFLSPFKQLHIGSTTQICLYTTKGGNILFKVNSSKIWWNQWLYQIVTSLIKIWFQKTQCPPPQKRFAFSHCWKSFFPFNILSFLWPWAVVNPYLLTDTMLPTKYLFLIGTLKIYNY